MSQLSYAPVPDRAVVEPRAAAVAESLRLCWERCNGVQRSFAVAAELTASNQLRASLHKGELQHARMALALQRLLGAHLPPVAPSNPSALEGFIVFRKTADAALLERCIAREEELAETLEATLGGGLPEAVAQTVEDQVRLSRDIRDDLAGVRARRPGAGEPS